MYWGIMKEAYDAGGETGIDLDYEFDAPRFYDFTCDETGVETHNAEAWFGTAPEHPPSPVAIKWNWNPNVHVEAANGQYVYGENLDPSRAGQCKDSAKGGETWNVGPNSPGKGSPRFMNPTASHLARKCDSPEILLCDRLLRRFERLSFRDEKKSLRRSVSDTRATKRQKLEVGYLLKGAPLDSKSAVSKLKVTVPREPNLVTAHRADRRRSKMSRESTESNKSSLHNFPERPANRKKLEAPSSPLPKMSSPRPQGQEFQAVDNSIPGGDSQNEIGRSRRVTPHAALMESGGLNKVQARCVSKKENDCRAEKVHDKPPLDLLSKLSLASETPITKPLTKMKEKSKDVTENAPAYHRPKHKIVRSPPESQRRDPIQYQECRRNGKTVPSLSQTSLGR